MPHAQWLHSNLSDPHQALSYLPQMWYMLAHILAMYVLACTCILCFLSGAWHSGSHNGVSAAPDSARLWQTTYELRVIRRSLPPTHWASVHRRCLLCPGSDAM